MHAGSYGLTPAVASRRRPGRPGAGHGRSGLAWYRRLRRASSPGQRRCPAWRRRWFPVPAVALAGGEAAGGVRDWPGGCGKTQLAAYLAGSLRRSRGVDLLAWVTAASRASVLSGYGQAAAQLGLDHAGDAEAVAARFLAWLEGTSRPWLVVLDDLRDAADLDGLMPAGPGRPGAGHCRGHRGGAR